MSKESLYGLDSRLLFRETFNSFDDIAKINKGATTSLNLAKGVATFNGTTSKSSYPGKLFNPAGNWSIRIRLYPTSFVNQASPASYIAAIQYGDSRVRMGFNIGSDGTSNAGYIYAIYS